jgi:hypothetical protein
MSQSSYESPDASAEVERIKTSRSVDSMLYAGGSMSIEKKAKGGDSLVA